MKVILPVYEMLIDESDESDLMVDFIALVDKPAIQKDFMKFAEDMPHYTADGVLWEGPTHKDADGRLMTGAVHSADSVYLYHDKQQMIVCKECGHSWAYLEGGEEPYKCNMCNYVNAAFESYSDYPDSVKNNAKAVLKYADGVHVALRWGNKERISWLKVKPLVLIPSRECIPIYHVMKLIWKLPKATGMGAEN
jgi:hypothetical protein